MGRTRGRSSGRAKAQADRRGERRPVPARRQGQPAGPRDMVLAMQQTAGNQATRALIHRLIGESHDGTAAATRPVPYQAAMERYFGESFADTRVATGRSDLGRAGADAATIGNKVAFADARPSRKVVAHELAHVVQNRRGPSPRAELPTPGDKAEVEADRASEGMASARSFTVSQVGTAVVHPGLRKWAKKQWKRLTGGGGGGGGNAGGGGHGALAQNTVDQGDPIEEHSEAYHRARFYHGTRKSFGSYQDEGLSTKYAGTGASAVGGEYAGTTKGKVYITPDKSVATGYGVNVMRPLLPKDRTKITRGRPHSIKTGAVKGGPGELTWDPDHPGASEQDLARYGNVKGERYNELIRPTALTSDQDIPSQNIVFDENVDPTDEQLLIIGQHYPSGPIDDIETLRANHRAARRQRRVSIGSLD